MAKLIRIAKTATAAVDILWEIGFFRSWRKVSAIDAHLAQTDHHFSAPELGMALMRAKHLTRRGTRGHYEYIQKHPFIQAAGGTDGKQTARRKK